MSGEILKVLMPWMVKPFQFLFHAEMHIQDLSDYGKRFAFINFDNSIEVSIYTFMYFNSEKIGLKRFKKQDLDRVKNSFFGKLEEFEKYIVDKNFPIHWEKNLINYYHEQRNIQYHDPLLSSPDTMELNIIRNIAFWVFSVLFEISDVEGLLHSAIKESEKSFPDIPKEFTKPIMEGIPQNLEKSFFIASILGGWNQNFPGDMEIIDEVTSGF